MSDKFHNIYSKNHLYQLNSYEEDQKVISNVIREISKQIDIKADPEADQSEIRRHLLKFDSFKEYPLVILFSSYSIPYSNPFKLLIITTNSSIERIVNRGQINRETIVEHEFVGFVRLKKEYPHTYIRPETIADKMNELFKPVEIDFENHKKFSHKYFVVSTNREKLKQKTTPEFLNAVAEYNDLEIEIIGSYLIVRTRSRVSMKTAFNIVNFLGQISNGKN